MRVVRLMRLLRHSTELQLFAKAISKSAEGLKMLVVLVSVAVLIFSALLWYAERGVLVEEHVWDEKEERWNGAFVRSDGSVSPFPSIPSTFWWAVVTMTTVGYGDTFPVEAGGKVVATVAMFAGAAARPAARRPPPARERRVGPSSHRCPDACDANHHHRYQLFRGVAEI